jgi:DNA-binding Lrp family transcriptional regulator
MATTNTTSRQELDPMRAALNAVGVTPSAREILGAYEQAFRSSAEAVATIQVLSGRARRARVVGLSQAQIARRAGVSPSTVSEVVDRLRRLDMLTTTGGEYLPSRRRNGLLRYNLRWSPIIDLSDGRVAQAHLCAAALKSGSRPEHIRAALARGEAPGRIAHPEPRQNERGL